MALGFTGSVERARIDIQNTYVRYLCRPAGRQGEDFWVEGFKMGLTIEDIVTGFIGSPEYFDNATT